MMALGLTACGILGPEPVCGCEPTGGEAVIAGAVVDLASAPVAGATVVKELLPNAPCSATAPGSSPASVVTGSPGGRFRFTNAWAGGNKCWRLWAMPPAGLPRAPSESLIVNINFSGSRAVPDSVELLLRLR